MSLRWPRICLVYGHHAPSPFVVYDILCRGETLLYNTLKILERSWEPRGRAMLTRRDRIDNLILPAKSMMHQRITPEGGVRRRI